MARRTDIRLLNIEKALILAENPNCVDFRVFDGQLAPQEEQVEAAVADKPAQQNALMEIEMQKLNYIINTPFANGFCVLEYNKLKMYYICLLLVFRNIM